MALKYQKDHNRGKKTLKDILKYLDVCIILHNLLTKNDDTIPDEWIDDDDFSDIDDNDRSPAITADDELNRPIPDFLPNDERRKQLTHYLMEHYII